VVPDQFAPGTDRVEGYWARLDANQEIIDNDLVHRRSHGGMLIGDRQPSVLRVGLVGEVAVPRPIQSRSVDRMDFFRELVDVAIERLETDVVESADAYTQVSRSWCGIDASRATTWSRQRSRTRRAWAIAEATTRASSARLASPSGAQCWGWSPGNPTVVLKM
jgi:hypothetical protein